MRILFWTLAVLTLLVVLFAAVLNYYADYSNVEAGFKAVFSSGMSLLFICFVIMIAVQIFLIWIFVDQVSKLKIFVDRAAVKFDELKKQNERMREDIDLLI